MRFGIGWLFSAFNNPYSQGLGKQLSAGALVPLAWASLAICWMAALASFFRQRRRKKLIETQTGLDSLRNLSWREFEILVGEAFRRQGYVTQETGLGGADGGIDLVLKKDGKTTLVQCKQWRTQRVDVKVVREMFGLLTHHRAAAVKIVAVGNYTRDAEEFVAGKSIELICGDSLLSMIRGVQSTSTGIASSRESLVDVQDQANAPNCPKCGSTMVGRVNRRTRDRFWGCKSYPTCRGTRLRPNTEH
ncbi:restriction endonuclease [Dokdonella sp.]|uniref:restriction endonuclease n=1 Tax=Dokdonella sp. TaxID=2291710 RepID=UPI003528BAF8